MVSARKGLAVLMDNAPIYHLYDSELMTTKRDVAEYIAGLIDEESFTYSCETHSLTEGEAEFIIERGDTKERFRVIVITE